MSGDRRRTFPADVSPSTDPTFFALNLSSYIFNVGYIGSSWADIELTFFGTGAKLHRSELTGIRAALTSQSCSLVVHTSST